MKKAGGFYLYLPNTSELSSIYNSPPHRFLFYLLHLFFIDIYMNYNLYNLLIFLAKY